MTSGVTNSIFKVDTLPSMQQTAANTFFNNPDLCTLLTQTLLHVHVSTTTTIKPCQTPSPTNPLLTFRGITRSTYNAVMFEHPARVALGLDAQDESAAGVLVVSPDPKGEEGKPLHRISHSKADVATLLTREIDEEKEKEQDQKGEEILSWMQYRIATQRANARRRQNPRLARIFTHHPAAAHQIHYDPLYSLESGTTLYMSSKRFFLSSPNPFARQIFLTQPPQKKITFGVRYEYCPGTRRHFTLQNDEGIRFGELVDFFEREPGMLRRPVDREGALVRFKRWLRDGEFIWMNRLEWEVGRGVVMGGELWRKARGGDGGRREG